jgi:hypothetical protein
MIARMARVHSAQQSGFAFGARSSRAATTAKTAKTT